MKKRIMLILVCISLSSFIIPTSATIHPDIAEGGWFIYDASFMAKPSFGVFEFSFNGRYKVTIIDITNDTVTTSVEVLMSTLPLNVSDVFLPIIAIPTEALVNDSLTMGNITIPFTSSVETDSSKYWRGLSVKIADLGSLLGTVLGADSTMKLKFDTTTGLLYEVIINAVLSIGSGVDLVLSLDISLTEANPAYRESMQTRYDHSYDAQFFFSDIVMAPWLIPIIILSAVIIILAVVLMSSRKQIVKKTPITSKTKMTRTQEQRKRMKSKVGRKPVKM